LRAIFLGILSLGATILAPSAWGDQPHHGSGGSHASHHSSGGGHVSHSSVHISSQHRASHSVVHRHFSAHRNNVHVTVHHSVHPSHAVHMTLGGGAHFHHVFRAPHRYHIGVWHGPRGFTYRRFGIGERIPAALLVADFFLTNYALYGLDAPDGSYVWVRDGDDAVLVDRYTGEVVEVEYDVFY